MRCLRALAEGVLVSYFGAGAVAVSWFTRCSRSVERMGLILLLASTSRTSITSSGRVDNDESSSVREPRKLQVLKKTRTLRVTSEPSLETCIICACVLAFFCKLLQS